MRTHPEILVPDVYSYERIQKGFCTCLSGSEESVNFDFLIWRDTTRLSELKTKGVRCQKQVQERFIGHEVLNHVIGFHFSKFRKEERETRSEERLEVCSPRCRA